MNVTFKDITINESGGYFSTVERLAKVGPVEIDKWVIESEFGILEGDEESYGIIQFWNNKECVLTAYGSSFKNIYFPVDMVFMYEWARERGWELLIDINLRAGAPDYWRGFDGAISEDEEMLNEEIAYDDDLYYDSIDFVEYKKESDKLRVPDSSKYDPTEELPEFKSHKYDLEKRKEKESNDLF